METQQTSQINIKTIGLIIAGLAVAIYFYMSITDPASVTNPISDWVSGLIGIAIFGFGIYYVMYGKFPSLR